MQPKVSSCIYYPLKSGKGIKADFLELTKYGPKHDRMWMLVNEKGEKLSQRDKGCEKMALIETEVHEDKSITFRAPGQQPLHLGAIPDNDISNFTVHGNDCHGRDLGDEAAGWFEQYLGMYSRLVSYAYEQPRSVEAEYSSVGDVVGFADGMPLLVTSTSSLEALRACFPENTTINMDRFRPNIVIEGLEAFEEDVIYKLRIGDVELEFTKPCARCVLTTVDQVTGEKAPGVDEPIRTLAKTRQGKGGGLQGVFFGQNAVPRTLGRINVGDYVEILSRQTLHPALESTSLKFSL